MEIFRENVFNLFFRIGQIDFIWILTENAFGNINFATNRNTLDRKVENENANTSRVDHNGSTWTRAFLSPLN